MNADSWLPKMLRRSESCELTPKGVVSTTPSKAQGALQKRRQEVFKSWKIGVEEPWKAIL